jgi:hypothetical protein
MSGYDDQAASSEHGGESFPVCLQKPFSMNLLLTRLAELSVRPDAVPESPVIAPPQNPMA